MKSHEHIKDVLIAIDSVKSRMKQAALDGDKLKAHELMGDLFALKVCLESECQKFVDWIEKEVA